MLQFFDTYIFCWTYLSLSSKESKCQRVPQYIAEWTNIQFYAFWTNVYLQMYLSSEIVYKMPIVVIDWVFFWKGLLTLAFSMPEMVWIHTITVLLSSVQLLKWYERMLRANCQLHMDKTMKWIYRTYFDAYILWFNKIFFGSSSLTLHQH